jgi:collagenase-like PrtC family protease
MASDKNAHLQVAAKLAKKHGVKNFVAVCPLEHDLAWAEEKETFHEKVNEAENEALVANPNMTILKPNLAFGPETHLIHFLT